jgi:predicted nuclease of predicted toxin-antitoxin system
MTVAEIHWYMDEQVPLAVTHGLRRRRIDVITVQELHETSASDEHPVELAALLMRVIFTQDADYLRIAATGKPHAGIVYTPQSTPVGVVVRGLVLITEVYTAEEMANHLEYLSE